MLEIYSDLGLRLQNGMNPGQKEVWLLAVVLTDYTDFIFDIILGKASGK